MASTLSTHGQRLRIESAREKALRGLPTGIHVLSRYDNPEREYWQNVNTVRKYITSNHVGVNKLPYVIRKEFSLKHLDDFFNFAVDAMCVNLGDAYKSREEEKEDKIKVSFDRAVDFFKFAWALVKDNSCEANGCRYHRLKCHLLDFRNMGKRELQIPLLIPSSFLKTL